MGFRFVAPTLCPVREFERVSAQRHCLRIRSLKAQSFGKQGQAVGTFQQRAHGLLAAKALTNLADSLVNPAEASPGGTADHATPFEDQCQTVLLAQVHGDFEVPATFLMVPNGVADPAQPERRIGYALRM